MRATLTPLALLFVCVCSGCTFDSSIDPNVTIIDCKSNDDCPDGYRCEPPEHAGDVSQCRREDATVIVQGPFGLPEVVRAGPVEAVFTFTSTSTDSKPIVRGTAWADGEPGAQVDFTVQLLADGGFRVLADVAASDPDGIYTLKAFFYDDTGASARAPRATFIVDQTPAMLTGEEPYVFSAAPGSAGERYFLTPTALGPGGKVRVSFRANEPVTGSVFATNDAGVHLSQIVFTGGAPAGGLQNLSFEGTLLLDGGDPALREVALVAELFDRAGNRAQLPLSRPLPIDAQPPVLNTSPSRTFVATHAPFGAADGGPKGSTLRIDPGQLLEDGTLVVIDKDLGNTALVAAVTADQPFQGRLLSTGPSYDVVLIDRAGSGSVPQPVRDGTLVYRPNDIAAGVQDGRSLEAWPAMIGSRHSELQSAAPFPVDVASKGRWRHVADNVTVPTNAAMACDADRGRVIRFGGTLRGVKTADTYVWQGDGWRKVGGTAAVPAATASEAKLAYDPYGQQTLMFHGPTGQTWTFKNDRWTPRLTGAQPPPRVDFSIAFDERSGQMLLFGGATPDGGLLGDTWEWDGIDWTKWDAGAGPRPRRNAAMSYDPGSQRVLLYGGSGVASTGPSGSAGIDEVWAFGGSPMRLWRPVTSEPGDRPDASTPMIMYDVRRRLLRVVAAESRGGVTSYELTYDGGVAHWDHDYDASVPANSPPVDVLTGVYDSARREAFVTDGMWRFQLPGRGWKVAHVADEQVPQIGVSMAWDEASQQVIMFGGISGSSSSSTSNNETWGFRSDAGWRLLNTSSPPAVRHSAALLPVDGGLLLAGGRSTNAMMFPAPALASHVLVTGPDGTGTWSQLPTGFVGATVGASNGYEAILWGKDAGYYSNGDVRPAATNALVTGDMVFDRVRALVVAFSGAQTWVSNALGIGSPSSINWVEVQGTAMPPMRTSPSLFFDSALQRVMTFGDSGPAHDRRVWSYTPGRWAEEPVTDLEGDGLPDVIGPMAYDESQGQAVMWGNGTTETWTLRYAGQRPAVVFHNVLSTQLKTTNLDGIELGRITATAIAGGDGTAPGAEVQIWNQGRWDAFGGPDSNASPASAPSAASLTILDRSTVEQILRGHSELSIAVTTVGSHGMTPAALRVSDLVVQLNYRYATAGMKP